MDAQGTMRLMFDTMDAYDRADFDRLAEIYAKDARWMNNVDPTPTRVVLTARIAGSDPVVSVFSFKGRRIASIADYPSMEAAEAEMAGSSQAPG